MHKRVGKLLDRLPALAGCARDIEQAFELLRDCYRAQGRLAGLADVCVRVPARETRLVQEYHLPVYHCLSLMLEDEFFA